tara:strand:- start:51 stop:452 length:402 start_codon:yes stop_codon:yes gene_type:complete
MKILIMGLPGSGKTTLASKLVKELNASWINADKIRKEYNDWDFSKQGVLRQSERMGELAKRFKEDYVIADFICPFEDGRKLFGPDYLIWMDTIKKGRLSTFDDNFEKPKKYNFRIKTKDFNVKKIVLDIRRYK